MGRGGKGESEGEFVVVRLSCNIFISFDAVDASAAKEKLLRTKTMTTFSSSSIFICIKQKPKVPRDEARAANFSQSLSRTLRQSKAHYSAAPEAKAAAAAPEEFFA